MTDPSAARPAPHGGQQSRATSRDSGDHADGDPAPRFSLTVSAMSQVQIRGGVGASIASFLFAEPTLAEMKWEPDPTSRKRWRCRHEGVHHQLEIESIRGRWTFWASAGYPYLAGIDPWVPLSFGLPDPADGFDHQRWKKIQAKVGRAYAKVSTEAALLETAARHGAGAREWDEENGPGATEWWLISLIGRARAGLPISWDVVQSELDSFHKQWEPRSQSAQNQQAESELDRQWSNGVFAIMKTAFVLATTDTWRTSEQT